MSARTVPSSLVPQWLVRHRRPVVWFVVSALVAMTVVSTVLGYSARAGAQPFAPQHPIVFLGSAAVIAAYAFVFALLVQRVPANVVGWIFGAFALAVATGNLSWAYLTYATQTIPPLLPEVGLSMLLGAMLIPWWTFLLVALIVSFPDGRPISPAYGWLVVATGVVAIVGSLAFAFGSGLIPVWMMESPLALSGQSGQAMAVATRAAVVILIFMVVPAIWSLIVRYRSADDIGRLQLKWLVYAGCVFLVCGLVFWLAAGVAYEPGSVASTAVWLLLCFGSIVVPLAASVAIVRYHLYDIETIIGRTLVYGGLTAILAGMYTAGIRLFNWLFVEATGESSDAALVLTTLVLATTFTPIKTWLEAKVASRRGVIADPGRLPPVEAERPADASVEIDAGLVEAAAERAAAIVLRRLSEASAAAAGSIATSPEPAPPPGRTTLE